MSESLHVYAPQPTMAECRRHRCPTCQRRTRFFGEFYEWYGWLITCLACGDQWQDGERLPRPFKPRWRQESIEAAKKRMRQSA